MRFLVAFVAFFTSLSADYQAVTYSNKGGRFGDRVVDYIHAKWVAYSENKVFLYHPFPFSEELMLSKYEIPFSEGVDFFEESDIFINGYYPESPWEKKQYHWNVTNTPNYADPNFIALLRQMIAPVKSINALFPPKDCVSIALHVREGGGYDPIGVSLSNPAKIPPWNFYETCLKAVLGFVKSEKIYCFMFTDAKNPEAIIEILQENSEVKKRIQFDYRKENSHKANVLEDFFSFKNFDILIRPDSNFSIVSSLIYDFAIICSPKDFELDEDLGWLTTEIDMKMNHKMLKNL